MSETTQRIDALSPQKKRALLLRLLKEKDRSGSVPPLRPRRQTTDRLPLSFAQQRLWFLSILGTDSAPIVAAVARLEAEIALKMAQATMVAMARPAR
jgi:hypothetical protein